MTTVEIPVKPYIKKYLEKDYGNPVNFSGVRGINDFFNLLLEKQSARRDKQTTLGLYTETITVVVTRDAFYRYGWDLSHTSIISFNSLFEFIIKIRSRDTVRIRANEANKKVANAIRQLQLDFNFSEDDYSFDAIKKDLQRHTDISKNSTKNFGLSVPKN